MLAPVLRRARAVTPGPADRPIEAKLEEAVGLAEAIGLDVRARGAVIVATPRPATLFGSGKVEELSGLIAAEGAELVIVDHPLTPVQQRNLERAWKAKVLDRTALILEIFGRRARTKEGRLQVELAHLDYQRSRLVRSWTHLERQRGGFGFLGGPGETQIETDRRLIQERMDSIRDELQTARRTRGLHRKSRQRVPYPIVALVGYTNAGKTTLFNTLTGASVLSHDMLFATLDPTVRALKLPGGGKAAISDTVGFVSELPTMLIAAFRATLEEVIEADLIVHVRDIADPMYEAQQADVDRVLAELGIDEVARSERLIEVWNKIDLLTDEGVQRIGNEARRHRPDALPVSAATGEGLDALTALIERRVNAAHRVVELLVGTAEGSLTHWLHEHGEVLEREAQDDGQLRIVVRLAADKAQQLDRKRRPGNTEKTVVGRLA